MQKSLLADPSAKLQLRPYQLQVKKDLYSRIREGHNRVLLVAGTGAGKCLGKGTKILMFDGSIKNVEDVKVGDLLMGDDSTPRTVLSLARGRENLYKVKPVKGEEWICNESHILSLVANDNKTGFEKNAVYDISVADYLGLSRTSKHILKQYRTKVCFQTKPELPIDPWLLGLFIGDGHKGLGSIHLNDNTKVSVAEKASSIVSGVGFSAVSSREDSQHGVRLSFLKQSAQETFISYVRKAWGGIHLKTHDIYIPFEYKTASEEDRLALLAGLIDADGSYENHVEISTVSSKLADGICFVARSVGLAAYKTSRNTSCNGKLFASYRVNISGDLSIIPSVRFDFQERKQIKNVLRTGLELIPLGEGDYYGFTIDGNHRFVLGDFTVTHNTETATAIVDDALSRGRKIAFVVHRDNLVRQTVARFSKYGLAPSAVHPDFPKEYDNPLQVVSIQTLTRRKDALHLLDDLTIYDEAHLTAWMRLSKDLILNGYHKITIGLTATPWRLSKREEMGDLFSALVLAPLPHELIKQGYLVPPKYWGLEGIDTQDVKMVMGDFSLDDLGLITSDPDCVKTAVDEWQRLAENRKTICFCVNVNHSQMLANEFNKRGIPAAHIDGTMDAKNEREPIYQKLRNGEILVVTSCEALAEGFDVPDIGCALLARPTKSKAKYLQQLGRALRIAEGKENAIILDQAGNVSRHGFVEDFTEKDFALTTSEEIERGEPPVKKCPDCNALIHISIMECPVCGYLFPHRKKEKANAKLVELRPTIPNESEFPQDLIEYRQWKREAFKKRIAPGFAIAKYRERYNKWIYDVYDFNIDLGAIFQGNATFGQMKAFAEYLKKVADKKGWDGSKIAQEWAKEFGDTKGLEGFMVLTMLPTPNAVNQ